MIIMFRMSLILPKLIVWHDTENFFIVHCMGSLGCPYPGFHLSNIFYLLLSSVGLSHHHLHSILLFFLLCILVSPLLSFSKMDSCYTLRMGFSSTISSSLPFTSSIPCHISCFPNHIGVLPHIFLVALY